MLCFASFANRVLADDASKADFDALCASRDVTREEAYNRVALAIAEEFDAARATFDSADGAINLLWSWIVQDLHNIEMPQPAYDIYEAFDRGEYSASLDEDPVAEYTRPLIRQILRGA